MAITVGENPEEAPGINKFLGMKREGHRGKVLAVSPDKRDAIVLAMTRSLDPDDKIEWGVLYHVREFTTETYPEAIHRIASIPDGWEIVV